VLVQGDKEQQGQSSVFLQNGQDSGAFVDVRIGKPLFSHSSFIDPGEAGAN